jgi:hypothetical protein
MSNFTPQPNYRCSSCPHYFGNLSSFNPDRGHIMQGEGWCRKNPPTHEDGRHPKTNSESYCGAHPDAPKTSSNDLLRQIAEGLGVAQ